MISRADDQRSRAAAGRPACPGAEPPRALIVVADERLRGWVVRRLCSAGFELTSTADRTEAMEAIQACRPDLILIDHVVQWLDVR